MSRTAFDRQAIRSIAEDYWRTMIPLMQAGEVVEAQALGDRFEHRVRDVVADMAPLDRVGFLSAMEAERERLIAEYRANPEQLKARLGLPATPVPPPQVIVVRTGPDPAVTAVILFLIVAVSVWLALSA